MTKAAVKKSSFAQLPNAFIGKSHPPNLKELRDALEKTFALWTKLVAELKADGVIDLEEWNSYSLKAGWALRLKRADRTILYLAPCSGCFRASFALGERAVAAARQALPEKIALIDAASRYAEGTAIRIDVMRPADITVVKKLAAIKVEN